MCYLLLVLIAEGASTEEEDTNDSFVEPLLMEDSSLMLELNFPQHKILWNSLLNCLK